MVEGSLSIKQVLLTGMIVVTLAACVDERAETNKNAYSPLFHNGNPPQGLVHSGEDDMFGGNPNRYSWRP